MYTHIHSRCVRVGYQQFVSGVSVVACDRAEHDGLFTGAIRLVSTAARVE